MGFWSRTPTRVLLLATKLYAFPRKDKTYIVQLMAGNTLLHLTSLISSYNGLIDVCMCKYEDNLMNSWTLPMNRGHFNLVESCDVMGRVQLR